LGSGSVLNQTCPLRSSNRLPPNPSLGAPGRLACAQDCLALGTVCRRVIRAWCRPPGAWCRPPEASCRCSGLTTPDGRQMPQDGPEEACRPAPTMPPPISLLRQQERRLLGAILPKNQLEALNGLAPCSQRPVLACRDRRRHSRLLFRSGQPRPQGALCKAGVGRIHVGRSSIFAPRQIDDPLGELAGIGGTTGHRAMPSQRRSHRETTRCPAEVHLNATKSHV